QEHLSSSFSKAQSLILAAKNLSRDVAHVEDLLSRARTAMENDDFQSALDFTNEALETITDDLTSAVDKEVRDVEDLVRTAAELAKQGFQALQQAQFQRVVGVIATSREKFTAAANMGIDIQGPMADLTIARDLLKRGSFRDALDAAKRADGAVDTIIQGYRT